MSPHVNRVVDEYRRNARKVLYNKNLSNHDKRCIIEELQKTRNNLSSKSSSSYSDDEALKKRYVLSK